MASQQVQLREAIKTQIDALIDLPAQTVLESLRYPRVKAEELDQLHLVFFPLDIAQEIFARGIDSHEFTVGLAIQKHVPGQAIEPIDDLLELVETIKTLWEPGGELREEVLANYSFKSLAHAELYDFSHLVRYGVFTSIVELTYTTEID